jgi:adenylosuccinate lyase
MTEAAPNDDETFDHAEVLASSDAAATSQRQISDEIARVHARYDSGRASGAAESQPRLNFALSRPEIAEVSEPAGDGRGGSSTMPQKRNRCSP